MARPRGTPVPRCSRAHAELCGLVLGSDAAYTVYMRAVGGYRPGGMKRALWVFRGTGLDRVLAWCWGPDTTAPPRAWYALGRRGMAELLAEIDRARAMPPDAAPARVRVLLAELAAQWVPTYLRWAAGEIETGDWNRRGLAVEDALEVLQIARHPGYGGGDE